MSKWIPIDPASLETSTFRRVGGIETTTDISPFDLPKRVRAFLNPESKRLVVEFGYLFDEPHRLEPVGKDPVFVRSGLHSGRMMGFEIDMAYLIAKTIEALMPSIKRALQQTQTRHLLRRRNYDAAGQVLDTRKQALFGGLLTAK